MRKVLAATFVSLDGVMQAPGGPEEDTSGGFKYGGWTFHHWDEPMGEVMDKVFGAPFDLLLGRKTYDIFAAHWPYIEGDPIAEKFNAVTKYVATTSAEPLTWKSSVALRRRRHRSRAIEAARRTDTAHSGQQRTDSDVTRERSDRRVLAADLPCRVGPRQETVRQRRDSGRSEARRIEGFDYRSDDEHIRALRRGQHRIVCIG
jgi:hypothetical protein